MKTYTLNLTPPQLHEVLTALNVNKHKIAGRIRHAERKSASPEELEKQAADPFLDLKPSQRASCLPLVLNTG